ncbi:hypothetical protein PMAN_a0547 [Pseudoalteromonas marina]|uniref:hypothetical protein n=1 Tax=Pseudoalteromonas marina TaxID=267375 RepID=UPI00026CF883|nr:hypothetical protein [Pseudoalteromonas marina]KAF7779635.1 hypothetical protein PMAN_a0547 [Pseudoalteromonas marina]
MSSQNLLSFHKEIYFFEIQRSGIFDSRLQIPIAAVVLLIGFQAYMIKEVNFGNSPTGVAIFSVLFLLSVTLTLISLIFMKKAWGGSKYKLIPLASTMEQYRQDLMEHYGDSNFKEGSKATNLYDETVLNYFIECSSFNSEINEKRARSLYLGVGILATAAALSILSFFPYFIYELDSKDSIDEIKIVAPIKVIQKVLNMTDSKKGPPPPPPPPRMIINHKKQPPPPPKKRG